MGDAVPSETPHWQHIEKIAARVLASYGYREIRLPLVEKTELFRRSIGEATDIVEKEMYTFTDRNGDSLTLRPEATASCVRALIEHGLLRGQAQRLWYTGPMFRHERPQKGRYRQFFQIGAEAIGLAETGKEIKPNRNKPIDIPPELAKAFKAHPKAKKSFDQMSKTCRREYAEHISDAKREETKARRIAKIIPMILESKGLNDKYR